MSAELTATWECFCEAEQSTCAATREQAVAAARGAGSFCYRIKEHACGLTTVFRKGASIDPGGDEVFDRATGALVGVSYSSDVPITCPIREGETTEVFSFTSGTMPGADCPATSCMGTCNPNNVLVPLPAEAPCAL
jgi:hypothetical protein